MFIVLSSIETRMSWFFWTLTTLLNVCKYLMWMLSSVLQRTILWTIPGTYLKLFEFFHLCYAYTCIGYVKQIVYINLIWGYGVVYNCVWIQKYEKTVLILNLNVKQNNFAHRSRRKNMLKNLSGWKPSLCWDHIIKKKSN